MSVLSFASDDEEAIAEFEAGWTLTINNIRSGIREPLRPEQVQEFARSTEFRDRRNADGRMVTGAPDDVVRRLQELKAAAKVDEIVVVTPGTDRTRRAASFVAIADAWRRAS
jgi:alkanesulfonate monooxygenase SsuD/methylene tetrahydromethanopterin reductase-like flavin-dependent oxidoreductase (luciferase family)